MLGIQTEIKTMYDKIIEIENKLYEKKLALTSDVFFFSIKYFNSTTSDELEYLDHLNVDEISEIFRTHIDDICGHLDSRNNSINSVNSVIKDSNPYLIQIRNIPVFYITTDHQKQLFFNGLDEFCISFFKDTGVRIGFANKDEQSNIKLNHNMLPLKYTLDMQLDRKRLIGINITKKNHDVIYIPKII